MDRFSEDFQLILYKAQGQIYKARDFNGRMAENTCKLKII